MKISIIVPAYNEEELLPRCLNALLSQAQAADAEIIVVDNNSTDRTSDIAERVGVRVVAEPRQGVIYALQRGLESARGEIVAFTDADTIVDSAWLTTIEQAFRAPEVVAITGPVKFAGLRILTSVRWFYRHMLLGSNMAVRRQVGLAAGGFDARYNLASDIAFGWALKKRGVVRYVPSMSVTTSSRRFQSQPLRQASRYILNHLWMLMFHEPLFWHFAPIRDRQEDLDRQARHRTWFLGSVMFLAMVAYLSAWPNSSVFGQVSVHGKTRQNIVSLTFDQGPNGSATRSIVDVLSARNVPATFFEIGQNIETDPATAKYVADHGFIIGNQSWDNSLDVLYDAPKQIAKELAATNRLITQTTGQTPTYFRSPRGWRSPQLLYEVRQAHLRLVTWSVDARDTTLSSNAIVSRVLRRVRHGCIIRFHDGSLSSSDRQATLTALPLIIDQLRQRGYTFVSLDAVLAKPVSSVFSQT